MIPIHAITFPGDSEFEKRFNYVSWLFSKIDHPDNSNEDNERWITEYCQSKLCLEQGYPISFLNEYLTSIKDKT